MSRPPFIISTADEPEVEQHYPERAERFAHGRAIGRVAGLQRIGLHVERVAPGERTSLPHAESDEEEFVLVLEGEILAWIDGDLHPMTKGDLAAFPAGTGIAHTFINDGAADALLLVGGERTKPTNRIVYPVDPWRRAQVKPEEWWTDAPATTLGPHDGTPRRR
jgi:uncharacterized cupin superfamily protein